MQNMQHQSGIKCTFEQVYLVYKFLETPMNLMLQGMEEKSDAKKYYRSIVKQLHPDKNAHPQAKEAFQKLQKAVEIMGNKKQY